MPTATPATYTDEMIVNSWTALSPRLDDPRMATFSRQGIVDGLVSDIAMDMIDHAVAAGEYDGCSTEMELAMPEYERRIRDVLVAAGEAVG